MLPTENMTIDLNAPPLHLFLVLMLVQLVPRGVESPRCLAQLFLFQQQKISLAECCQVVSQRVSIIYLKDMIT
jgi:hypothetical protein